jgi:hypothetical protein
MHTPSKIAASSAKRLTIKPETHAPKPGLRLRLANGGGSGPAASLQNGIASPVVPE